MLGCLNLAFRLLLAFSNDCKPLELAGFNSMDAEPHKVSMMEGERLHISAIFSHLVAILLHLDTMDRSTGSTATEHHSHSTMTSQNARNGI